jgi:3-hydroxyisobutyrate dehydrogenase-like beta-hydroxyacid dehydrogenase
MEYGSGNHEGAQQGWQAMADRTPDLGFIGLGLMGHAFTKRLVACGHRVTGYDVVADRMARAEAHGVHAATSAAEVTRASDIVHVCVMTKDDLAKALFGANGIAEGAAPGKVLVDHSTTEVETTRQFAARLEADTGMRWVDAPVSGGPPAAEAGTLAIMAGGDDADVTAVRPVLEALGTCTHMGPLGAGQVTKMVNQVLVLSNYCVLAEALVLAEAGGVDASRIPAALGAGYAGSNMLQRLYPRLVARDFTPAGYAFQALKDLDMVHGLAKELKVPTPMASQAATLFRTLVSKGHGELDGIAVLKLYDGNEHL